MKLLIEELKSDGLIQEIRTPVGVNDLGALRPHLYKHNSPAGSLKLEIRDTNSKLVATSETLAISALSTASFFHGKIRFLLDKSLPGDTVFNIKLVGIGYTFAEAAYIGWNKDFDLRILDANYSPSTGFQSAFIIEPWTRRRGLKGVLNV